MKSTVYRLFRDAAFHKRRELRRWEREGWTSGFAYAHLRWSAESNTRIAKAAYLELWKARLRTPRDLLLAGAVRLRTYFFGDMPASRGLMFGFGSGRWVAKSGQRAKGGCGTDVGPSPPPVPMETCSCCRQDFRADQGHLGEVNICPACLEVH